MDGYSSASCHASRGTERMGLHLSHDSSEEVARGSARSHLCSVDMSAYNVETAPDDPGVATHAALFVVLFSMGSILNPEIQDLHTASAFCLGFFFFLSTHRLLRESRTSISAANRVCLCPAFLFAFYLSPLSFGFASFRLVVVYGISRFPFLSPSCTLAFESLSVSTCCV